MIEKLSLERFTAFEKLDMQFAPGVNLMIGQNGTGKTHILKIVYSVLAALREGVRVPDKIVNVFLPAEKRIGRLVKRVGAGSRARVCITRNGKPLRLSFSNHTKETLKWTNKWDNDVTSAVYIPVKEMLANAPGFRSLYAARDVHFEEVYADIIDRAFLPILRGPISKERKKLLAALRDAMEGKVVVKKETFYLQNRQGDLEFTLVAEGLRKFALLWLLIQNGTLLKGSTLFWDEPEANINPSMIGPLVRILLQLEEQGVQIFIATHSYVVLKEFELQRAQRNSVRFFSLSRDERSKDIRCISGEDYNSVVPNKVSEAFTDLYDREIERTLGGTL